MDKHLLHTIIENHAAVHGGHIAVIDEVQQLNYRELNVMANRIAHALLNTRLEKGDRVGIFMMSSAAYIASVLGVWKAGGIIVPLDAGYPKKRIESFVAEAQPKIGITTAALLEKYKDYGLGAISDSFILRAGAQQTTIALNSPEQLLDHLPDHNPGVQLTGTDSNYLIYTSGSTGKPKGIEGIHKCLSHFIHWEAKTFALNQDTRVSQLAPVTFDVSFRDIFVPLFCGGTLCIPSEAEKYEPTLFLKWVAAHNVSLIHCVPTYFKLILSAVAEDSSLKQCLHSVKHILIAGEALYGSDVNSWYDGVGEEIDLVNLYGPSETTLAKLFYRIPKKRFVPEDIIPLGNPIANTVALIVQGTQLCRAGEEGEILIKTPFLTRGYYKNPALTSEKFIQNPLHNDFEDIVFKTGDMGHYGDDGLIFFSGRSDDMVKYNGNRIELNEIQKVAMKVPGIHQAVVQLNRSLDGSEVLALYYNSWKTVDKATILQYYNAHLPFYMHPGKMVYITQFPTLPNGKVDRQALQDIAVEEMPSAAEITDPVELEILEIWQSLLAVDEVGNQQSFFQLGGSSLKAIQMISKIYKQKGVLLNLREILSDPTISGIKTLLEEKKSAAGEQEQPLQEADHGNGLSAVQVQILSWAETESQWADFNMPYIYTLNGPLDLDRLEKAIRRISESHSFFRQHLIHTDKGFEFKLTESAFKGYRFEDISALSREEVAAYLEDFIRTPFSKREEPLIKLRTLRLANDEHLFVILSHLVKSDGVTVSILMEAIVTAYLAFEATEKTLNDLATYKLLLDKEHNAGNNKAYWDKVYKQIRPLAGLSEAANPFDSAALRNYSFTMDSDAVKNIEALAKAYHTSVRVLLIACFEHCMASLLGVQSFTYYNVVSDRARYERKFLGNALYYLPFNVTVAQDTGFESRLETVQEHVYLALDHLPFVAEKSANRPEIALNIIAMEAVSPNPDGLPDAITIDRYPDYEYRERFPVSVSIAVGNDTIALRISAMERLTGFGTDFEKLWNEQLNKHAKTFTS